MMLFRRRKPEGDPEKPKPFYETPEGIRQALDGRLEHYGRLKAVYEAEVERLKAAFVAAEAGIVAAATEAGIAACTLDRSLFAKCENSYGQTLAVFCFPERHGSDVEAILLKAPGFDPSHEDVIVLAYRAKVLGAEFESGRISGFRTLDIGYCETGGSGNLEKALRFVLDQAAMRIAAKSSNA